ncbi:penicillin-binding protein 1C [Brumimicrobium aurantiacum]|uniref:peptidoglycan glycosyltransferase n=1 Tax=Brumimicrobium aurantiacum TaxID=1737063 RepID=A0A3E1EZN0_9FLAO|nr:penicillin-binding protein 1C [Brumimicrobium aurantiacum]RFC55029.1 penicillin-binding protein 1C [Brumimicrobium aurantiacum]
MRTLAFAGVLAFLVYFIGCLPNPLFKQATSTILLSKDGRLMNAKIAEDGQWRFPVMNSVPSKFKAAIIAFEDHDFYDHVGVSLKAIGRAVISNFKAKKIVSGGSTITMQIARMARNADRTFYNKLIESIWALRLETRFNKDDLLSIYASHAPFGGNVVGLEAASWRYYGLPPTELSWSQAATLAVLPNAPGLVHPGKNRDILLAKRNKVLKTLHEHGEIDDITYELSLEESLIGAPQRLPSLAPHLLENAIKNGRKGQRIKTSLDFDKQQKLTNTISFHQKQLNQNFIHNAAMLVIDAKTNEVVTYIGNSAQENKYQQHVDIIQAPRSSGSVLKPFLYAAMTQEGMLHNDQLIPDVPMHFDHFTPQNYDETYEGAVKAGDALARSLNVPAVYLLKQYGIDKFLHKLRAIGQHQISKSAEHYGLSLILGGAETTLWDIANSYAGMTKTLNFYNQENKYNLKTWKNAKLFTQTNEPNNAVSRTTSKFEAGAIYTTFQALLSVNRPHMEASWEQYTSSSKIAWKTGTSYGNRDAWAVGCTPDYIVAVWVGNATGEGRPGIIGTTAAAPIMFDAFSYLQETKSWFIPPYDELVKMSICSESGHRSAVNCTKTDTVDVHFNALRGSSCNFHEVYLTDQHNEFRYNRSCINSTEVQQFSQFVLPPLQANFYKHVHPNYRTLPPYHPDCKIQQAEQTFTIIYPEHNSKIIGTIDLDGDENGIVLEASHPNTSATLFWHVDQNFLGKTKGKHTLKYKPEIGKHLLTVLDEFGNQKKILFEVLE